MNSRKSHNSNIDVHRASSVKHLRKEKLLENEKQNDLTVPDWLFAETDEKKM